MSGPGDHATTRAVSSFSHVTFELHSLGWKAFQDLCGTVLSEVLGQTFKIFSPGRDAGRDGAFHGAWKHRELTLEGQFVAQCKFTSKPGKVLSLATLGDEIQKAARLTTKGLADNYLLLTNHSVTGAVDAEISDAFVKAGVGKVLIFGAERICQWIAESSRLRQLVPRLYGLGDLSQILDERVVAQTEHLLLSLQDDLRKFVPTGAYRQAVAALNEHGFVLLLGEPACGKSAIASTLALAAPDSWGCIPLKVDSGREFKRHWNPHEPRRLFWIDDAFGATQHQSQWVHEWNANLGYLAAAVRAGAKVVLTSRNYIYERARRELKHTAFPLFQEAQVVVRVEQLSERERQQILYNHVRLGDQPSEIKSALKPYLNEIARHAAFRPEIARRLGTRVFTRGLQISKPALVDFVERPMSFLNDVLVGLHGDHFAGLALLFMHAGRLTRPVELLPEDRDALQRLGIAPGRAAESLAEMEGSFTRVEQAGEEPFWTFRHPSIRDALATFVAARPDLLDIYLRGTPTGKLMQEITCGDVGLAGVRLVVPGTRFVEMLTRLEAFRATREPSVREGWSHNYQYYDFLATRCSREFLELTLRQSPGLLDNLSRPGSYLGATGETALVARLVEYGLFPEENRARWVAAVKELAVEVPDADFLAVPRIRLLLTGAEIAEIGVAIKNELLPSLDRMIEDWDSNYQPGEDPRGYFDSLSVALLAFKAEWFEGQAEGAIIDGAVRKIEEAIEYREQDIEPDRERDYDSDLYERSSWARDLLSGNRSIFEDVDE